MSCYSYVAVACDVHGCEMAEHRQRADCIANAIDEAYDEWNGWDALYSIRVYRVYVPAYGDEEWEVVDEEFADKIPMLD